MRPNTNQFDNLYFKVFDSSLNEVISATPLVKDSQTAVALTNLNQTLNKSASLQNLTSVTYTIVFWINEIHDNQTSEDSGKLFAATLYANSTYNGSGGITAVVSLAGNE